jgi:membrane-associated phospholipid phosphatase
MRTHHLYPVAMAAILTLFSAPAVAATDGYSDKELSADIVTLLLPVTTWGIAHYKDDGDGEGQFFRSTGVSLLLNSSLRLAFNETDWGTRPNGSPYGFPSGHAAFVTSSAAFLQDRFGWKFGVPAYALVGYVSYVRVDTDHHRWRDIGAAVALSMGVSRLFVTPHDATHIAPIVGPDWLGMRIERSF